MTLRSKLLLAQAPLAIVLVLLGAVSLRTIGELGRGSENILKDNYRSVLAAQRMKDSLEMIERTGSSGAIGQFESELKTQEDNITEPGEMEATVRVRTEWTAYRQNRSHYGALRDAVQTVLDINQDAMVQKSEQARATAASSRSLALFATLAGLAIGLFASVSLTSRALRPLSRLAMAVRRIGEGDLDARARIAGEDEIARLGREFDTMADRLREYRSSSLGELLMAQQSSQAAIDSLPDPVLVLGVDGRVLNVNQAAETGLQIQAGADPLGRADPVVREVIEMVRQHVVSGKGAYVPRGLEDAVQLRDRRLLPRGSPLYSEQGAITGATVVLQDVTRLVRFDELKNDLVATVAHEFRTPLTSLRMAIHILIEGTVGRINEQQADMLYAAREDCERLQGIVDDLLDLSRIQAGKVEVSPAPISSKALVEAAVANHEHSAGVKLRAEVGEPVLPVLADAERIQLVFDNLIGNAIRHSPRGGEIVARSRPNGSIVRFEVEDHGPGIPLEYQQRIFDKFFRMPGTKGEGIGLGLYISREVIAAHGGEMGVESTPGHGSRFWFTLRVP
jgi:signal transduction histidine kinase